MDSGSITDQATKLKAFLTKNKYLVAILLVAFWLRVWGINFGLPDFFPHTDETFALGKAKYFFQPELRPGPGVTIFHLWGWIFYQVLALVKFLFPYSGEKELTTANFMWWARLISALLSTGSVWLVYLVSMKLFSKNKLTSSSSALLRGREIGLLAAMFLTLTFVDVRTAHYFRQDTYIQFFGLLLLVAYLLRPKKMYLWTFLMGMVAAMRETAWVYLIPIGVDWWFKNKTSYARKLEDLFKLGLLSISGWIVAHPDMIFKGEFMIYLRQYFNFFTKESFNWVGGDTSNGVPNYVWWFNYLSYTGLFVTLFGVFGVSYLGCLLKIKRFIKDERWSYLGILLAIFVYFVALMVRSVKFSRHFIPLTPLVAVVAGYGLVQIWHWLSGKVSYHKLIMGFLLGLIFAFPLLRSMIFDYQIGLPDTRIIARDWIMENYGENQIIVTSGEANIIGQILQHYGYRKVVNFFPIEKYGELSQVPEALFMMSSVDYRGWENYQTVEQMGNNWRAYQQIKKQFQLVKRFDPPIIEGSFFSPYSLELSSTVNVYHNPVVEIYSPRF